MICILKQVFVHVVQIHGWLMAISWGVLVPVGLIFARNFKELGPTWFHVHRIVMVLAVLGGIAGTAIGVHMGSKKEGTLERLHFYGGYAVMGMALLQVNLSISRPNARIKCRDHIHMAAPYPQLGMKWIGMDVLDNPLACSLMCLVW